MNNQNIEQLKEINDKILELSQKRTQYVGAIESLKSQQKDLEKTIKEDYKLNVNELEEHISKEKSKLEQEQKSIIEEFTKLYENETIQSIFTIQPPFTVDDIYKEIQNNLLNYKSKVEAEINSLTNQQKDIETTLKEDFDVNISNIDNEVQTLGATLSELELKIQHMYSEIISDEDIKSLIERG